MKKILTLLLLMLVCVSAHAVDTKVVAKNKLIGLGVHDSVASKIVDLIGGVQSLDTALLPNANNTIDLGTAALSYRVAYTNKILADNDSTSALDPDVITATTAAPLLGIAGTSLTQAHVALVQNIASAQGADLFALKTRAAAGSTNADTIIVSGDNILKIRAFGSNGATYDEAARITMSSGGTPGASADMPGKIEFLVSADGSATPGVVMTIPSTGVVNVPAGVTYSAGIMETVAAGTSAQGDGPLTAGKFIHLVTGFDETKVATLPACAAGNVGELHIILNSVTNKFAKIFPATGGTINSLSLNAAYTQGVTGQGGKVLMCACQAANQWYCA